MGPLIERAIAASRVGDTEAALSLLEEAIASGSEKTVAYFLFASEQASIGEFEEAEAGFANAVLLAPQWHLPRYQLGLLQFSSGRAAVALVTWAPLFDLDASNCVSHFVKGFALLAQGNFAEATSRFRAGLSLPIDNPALAGDINKVLVGIERLHASSTTNGPACDEAASAHVLVSNYGRFVKPD